MLAVKDSAMRVIIDSEDYQAQAALMWAGMLAHNNICGVGREQDWASHALAHQLSALYDVAHGAALAVVFPAWLRYCLDEDVNLFAQLAARVWQVPESDDKRQMGLQGIERFQDFLRGLGLPSKLEHLDVPAEAIPQLVEQLHAACGDTVGNFKKLTMADAEAIYKDCQ